VQFYGVDLDKGAANFFADLGMVVDADGNPHFLVSARSPEMYFPLDSSFIGEVHKVDGNWEFYPLAFLKNQVKRRFLAGSTPLFYSELEFAKSLDGRKIYAKWIEPDSIFYPTPNGNVLDSMFNIFITSKDIGNNKVSDSSRGWLFPPVKVTDTPTIMEKYSKLARFANSDNRVFCTYTIFAPGDFVDDDDDAGESTLYFVSDVVVPPLVSAGDVPAPMTLDLRQNFPNPFNPGTAITFTVPRQASVSLKVYSSIGTEVATLVDGTVESGTHTVRFDGHGLPSGVYRYRLESVGAIASKTMVLLK
jgi:hypothetical protein